MSFIVKKENSLILGIITEPVIECWNSYSLKKNKITRENLGDRLYSICFIEEK